MKDKSSKKRKGKREPLKAQLFSVLEIVIMFLMVGIVLCLLADIINIPGWAKWTLYVVVLLICLISICYIGALRKELLKKSGYGIKILERWGARGTRTIFLN